MRKIKSFLICLVTVYLVVFSKPISALSIIDDGDYDLGSNVSMIENTIELNIGEKLKNSDVLNCFRIKNDENVSIKYIEKEQELKVTIKDGADTYVVSINVDIQDTEFSNKPVLAYLLLVFSLCLTLTFIVFYGKCV